MKVSEMNATQKKAFVNVKYAADDLIGSLENIMMDNIPESEEYKQAAAELGDHARLVEHLYEMATTGIYGEGFCCFDTETCKRDLREINFCGKAWIMERCEKRITKEGY